MPGQCRRELAEASERALRSCVQAGWPTLESVLCIGYVRQGMRLTVLLLAAFVLACCGGSTSTGDAGQSGAASSAPSSALPSPQAARSEFLTGNASPTYPAGTPGQIAVVAQATLALPVPSGGETVPIVVRNNTAHTVTRIAAQGAVHDASRKPVATGSDQGLHPAVLQPGQGPGFHLPGPRVVRPDRIDHDRPGVGPTVVVPNHRRSRSGRHGGERHRSPDSRDSQEHAGSFDPGSYSVDVFCLAASGAPSAEFGAFADSNEDLAAGASSGFTVDLYGAQCAQYLIGASGYDQGAVGN